MPKATSPDSAVDPRAAYFLAQENHLKFLHASPPLVSQILHMVIVLGLIGIMMKLYKPTEANYLFDGASLVLYMIGVTIYIANLVKGMRTISAGYYGGKALEEGESMLKKAVDGVDDQYLGREDSLRVMSASNTILALVLIGVLVLQAGQWYAQRKEAEEMEAIDKADGEKKTAKAEKGGKKKQ